MTVTRKKLIEVALPLDAINDACRDDKNRKTGTIRNLHKWFAPMPVPALRAAIFSALVDAPEDHAELSELLKLVEQLVASGVESPPGVVLEKAKKRIEQGVNGRLPVVLDPFCGAGSTLVEAQRLGLLGFGSDLNPVPVLISRVLTEDPPRLRDRDPVTDHDNLAFSSLGGFLHDVRSYARRIYEAAWEELQGLYPKSPNGDPVIAWWWCRTVRSPDPSTAGAHTPVVRTWWLSREEGKQAYVEPVVNTARRRVSFEVRRSGQPQPSAQGRCVFTDSPYDFNYLKEEGAKGNLGTRLIAMVSYGERGRGYHSPTPEHEDLGLSVKAPELDLSPLPQKGLGFRVQPYGIRHWEELFTARQQVALSTFAGLVSKIPDWVEKDGGEEDWGRAIARALGLCVGKLAQFSSQQTLWKIDSRNGVGKAEGGFGRNDIPMTWDYVEVNPFGRSVGDWLRVVETSLSALKYIDPNGPAATVRVADARTAGNDLIGEALVVTDPPYFDAIGYADLSDFFYLWIRRALGSIEPDLFATVCAPRASELIADPGRHQSGDEAEDYFVRGFESTFSHLRSVARQDFPILVVYASKEKELAIGGSGGGGWEAMLQAICNAGLAIVGTWPIHGTGGSRLRGQRSNALATYVLLVCSPKPEDAADITRRDFVWTLRNELPQALQELMLAGIAPVDLAQAFIGPGMRVYSRHNRVLDGDGCAMGVRDALRIINQTLVDLLSEQAGQLDHDSQFAVDWFENYGFSRGPFGVADGLARARNNSVDGITRAGIGHASAGQFRLFGRAELPDDWDPSVDRRPTVWEATQHLIKRLEERGERDAAELLMKLGPTAEQARSLAYRLFTTCERKKWAEEALAYNGLVLAWPELEKLASETRASAAAETQAGLFD